LHAPERAGVHLIETACLHGGLNVKGSEDFPR